MNTTPGGRKRLMLFLVSLGAIAFGFVLPGVLQRNEAPQQPPTAVPTLPPAYKENQSASALMLEHLRGLGQAHRWEQIVSQAQQYCGEDCTLGIQAMRAESLMRLNRNAEAADAWRTLPANLGSAQLAPMLLLEGRLAEYNSLCDSLLIQLDPEHPDPVSGRAGLWAALLSPTPADPKRLLELARIVDRVRGGQRVGGGSLLALALLRAGNPEEALQILEDVPTLPQIRAIRALALRHEGRLGEALQEARLFRLQLDDTFGTPRRDRIELLLLRRELDTPPIK